MRQRLVDYLLAIMAGALAGLLLGALASDPWGGALIGAVVGVFGGAGVRAWRSRDRRESYEDRSLGD